MGDAKSCLKASGMSATPLRGVGDEPAADRPYTAIMLCA